MPTDILKLSMEGKTGSLCSEGSLPCSSRFDDGTRGWGNSSPKLTWMPQHRSAFSVKRWWTISSATRIPSARQYACTACRAKWSVCCKPKAFQRPDRIRTTLLHDYLLDVTVAFCYPF